MRALVVDDSRLARNELKRLLKEFDRVQVIGEAANAMEAKERIETDKPDLVFLDIQMPGKNGFALPYPAFLWLILCFSSLLYSHSAFSYTPL